MAAVRTGGCLCGKIRYKLEGKATTPIYNTVCHCVNCRKATGSALHTSSICLKDGFSITQGEDALTTYFDTTTESGKPLRRTFCSQCGSKLFAFTPIWDEIVGIAAGSLDNFEEWKPDKEQWCDYRADFVERVKGVDAKNRHTRSVQSKPEGA